MARRMVLIKAISAIKNHPVDVSNVEEIKKVRRLGKRTRDKIQEIILTGGLQKLKDLSSKERTKVLEDLTHIWGVGPTMANKLYDEYNIKSIQDLRNRI